MNLEAFVLGCGGMMPLPYRHLTSVLIRREGDLFLFDGGEGTQVSLKRLNLKWKKINAIFVSRFVFVFIYCNSFSPINFPLIKKVQNHIYLLNEYLISHR